MLGDDYYKRLFPLIIDFELLPNGESYDFNCISHTKVALYTKNGIPTHACIQHNYIYWESKIGSAGIIRHDLFEIEGDSYGQLTQIYKKLKVVNEILLFKDFNSKNLLKVFKCA